MVGKQGWHVVTSELGIPGFLQPGFPSHARASGVTAKCVAGRWLRKQESALPNWGAAWHTVGSRGGGVAATGQRETRALPAFCVLVA